MIHKPINRLDVNIETMIDKHEVNKDMFSAKKCEGCILRGIVPHPNGFRFTFQWLSLSLHFEGQNLNAMPFVNAPIHEHPMVRF
jgi:hypothetical protein